MKQPIIVIIDEGMEEIATTADEIEAMIEMIHHMVDNNTII
jgi:hypothetical protein